jgi:hypothetical protein
MAAPQVIRPLATIARIYAHCERNPQRIFRYSRIIRSIRFLYNVNENPNAQGKES